MFGRKGGLAAKQNAPVWLTENGHQGADRSIRWDEDSDNLDYPDILVVDRTTMTADVLQRIDKNKLDRAQTSIWDKLIHVETIIVITQSEFSTHSSRPPAGRPDSPFSGHLRGPHRYSNYYILLAVISARSVPGGSEIRASDWHFFKYIDAVEGFGFLIGTDRYKNPPGPTGAREAELHTVRGLDIADNSGHHLGFALTALNMDRHRNSRWPYGPGRLVLLPPPTEPIGEAIEKIVSVYKGASPFAEAPSAWARQIPSARADQVQAQIEQVEGWRGKSDGQIEGLRQQKSEMLGHQRLLYAKCSYLENAVGLAFKARGFAKIGSRGGRGTGDGVLGSSTNGYQRAVVEVKSADKKTGRRHIVQCNKWVNDLVKHSKASVKGVFVPWLRIPEVDRAQDIFRAQRARLRDQQRRVHHPKLRPVRGGKKGSGRGSSWQERNRAENHGRQGVLHDVL